MDFLYFKSVTSITLVLVLIIAFINLLSIEDAALSKSLIKPLIKAPQL